MFIKYVYNTWCRVDVHVYFNNEGRKSNLTFAVSESKEALR